MKKYKIYYRRVWLITMKRNIKVIFAALIMFTLTFAVTLPVFAATETVAATTDTAVAETDDTGVVGDKAMAAAVAVGIAAGAGAIGMGIAIAKSVEAISRQPEAEGKVRTTLMLGLVFVETAIIYALVIAILIIFVL